MKAAPLQFPEWQREYEAALLELRPAKLPQRAMIAEFALLKRLRSIADDQNDKTERQKIEGALSNLRWLMRLLEIPE
jgi:surfactin synthase thioesterase subunit